MRRTFILAGLASTLLVTGGLAVILANTESAPAAAQEVMIPSPTASANPRAATLSGSQSASMAVAPSPTGMPAAPVRSEPGRNPRSARAAFLAAKLQQVPKVRQGPAPAPRSARESLPPEEVAAMEARGMDWRNLERMMRGGVPGEAAAGEAAAAGAEETPEPSEGHEETR